MTHLIEKAMQFEPHPRSCKFLTAPTHTEFVYAVVQDVRWRGRLKLKWNIAMTTTAVWPLLTCRLWLASMLYMSCATMKTSLTHLSLYKSIRRQRDTSTPPRFYSTTLSSSVNGIDGSVSVIWLLTTPPNLKYVATLPCICR